MVFAGDFSCHSNGGTVVCIIKDPGYYSNNRGHMSDCRVVLRSTQSILRSAPRFVVADYSFIQQFENHRRNSRILTNANSHAIFSRPRRFSRPSTRKRTPERSYHNRTFVSKVLTILVCIATRPSSSSTVASLSSDN